MKIICTYNAYDLLSLRFKFGVVISTSRLRQKKGLLIKQNECIDKIIPSSINYTEWVTTAMVLLFHHVKTQEFR